MQLRGNGYGNDKGHGSVKIILCMYNFFSHHKQDIGICLPMKAIHDTNHVSHRLSQKNRRRGKVEL
jgi:hypothetical protein